MAETDRACAGAGGCSAAGKAPTQGRLQEAERRAAASGVMGSERRRQASLPLPPLGDADRQAETPKDNEGDGEEPGAAGHSNDAQAGHQREQVEHDTGHVQALLN